MGTTIIVALAFWAAASFIEYKIIKTIPGLKGLFDNFVFGILISLAIGYLVTIAVGPSFGVGAGLGQILGVATNQSTFNFYSWLSRTNDRRKTTQARITQSYKTNKVRYDNAAETIRLGFRGLAAMFYMLLWIIALPQKIYRKISQ